MPHLDEMEGAPRITTVELTVRAQVPRLDAGMLDGIVGQAADLCPSPTRCAANVEINVRSELVPNLEITREPGSSATAAR
jgi:hypothetical protein